MGSCNSNTQSKKPESKILIPSEIYSEVLEIVLEEKPKEILIKFSENNKILFESKFNIQTKFEKIIDFINQKINKYQNYEYLFSYGKVLLDLNVNKNTTISKLLSQKISEEIMQKEEFTIQIRLLGLDITDNIKNKLKNYNLIGSPIEESDPFEVVIYDKENNNIHSVNYKLSPDKKELEFYSNYSAYCNANDKLYISGGEKNSMGNSLCNEENSNKKELLRMFYCLDLKKGIISKLTNLTIARSWHSMIYLPEKFIFFVGGINTESVEYYDLEKNLFFIESNLNEGRCETTLCCMNSEYLYAFYGYNLIMEKYSDTIEKLNLKKKKRNWEKVVFKDDGILIISRCFGISLITDSKAIILGGIDVDLEKKRYYNHCNMAYIFDHEKNEITLYKNEISFDYFLGEKFFYPVDDNKFFIFPINDNYSGFIFSENEIEKVIYNEKNNKVFEESSDLSNF